MYHSANFIPEPDGSQTAYVCYTDISAQKAAEDKLKRQAEYLQRLYDTMPCGISQYSVNDLGGAKPYHYVNRRGREIYGVSEANKDRLAYARVHPDDRDEYTKMLKNVIANGEASSYELRFIRRDGGIFWISGIIERITDIAGNDIYPVSYTHLDVYKRQVRAS